MHRFFCSKTEIRNEETFLSGSEWRHCQTVLRLQTGERLTLFDGEGNEYLAEITSTQSKKAQLRILNKTNTPPPPHSITLVQALPKNKAMDFIIQKATELGVREIIPVQSERSTVRLDSRQADEKIDRWREITIEAAKQCGLNWLPVIRPLHSISQAIGLKSSHPLGLIGSLQPDAQPLWNYLRQIPEDSKIILMIGPEGDFTPAELASARSAGFLPLSLGPLILRCDTASVCAITMVSYELGRLSAFHSN